MRLASLLVLCLLVAGCGSLAAQPAPTSTPQAVSTTGPAAPAGLGSGPEPPQWATVVEVADGDTITVRLDNGSVETVRYLGIDAPATSGECFGREAAAKNAELVSGRRVALQFGVRQRDQDQRLLRYVWVTGESGPMRMVNVELLRAGVAAGSSSPPDAPYQQAFLRAEEEARTAKRGLWGACSGPNQALPGRG